jgi:hypothetical protein
MQRIFFFRLESSTLALMSENRRNKLRDVEFRVLADRVAHLVAPVAQTTPQPLTPFGPQDYLMNFSLQKKGDR